VNQAMTNINGKYFSVSVFEQVEFCMVFRFIYCLNMAILKQKIFRKVACLIQLVMLALLMHLKHG